MLIRMHLHLSLILGLIALFTKANSSEIPYLTLYTEPDQGGGSYTTRDAVSDLGEFSDTAESLCGLGLWFLYDNKEFSKRSDFVHSFVTYVSDCETLDPYMRDTIRSVRYAGSDDLDAETLTLYEDDQNCGGEFLITRDISQLDTFNNKASSFVVTGNSSWTIYADSDYSGGATCIQPKPDENGWYYGIYEYSELGFPNNEVSSVKKGCTVDMHKNLIDASDEIYAFDEI